MNIQTLTPDELIQIKKKRSIRRMLAKKSHFWFFSIYLGHYIGYPFAPFHHEMFTLTEDINLRLAVLVAFRGSGKSTLMSLSYPIWAVVGSQQKKFVLIVSQTQAQARLHLSNIKKELETNELLKNDIGPFEEISDEWGATSIVLSNFGARIAIASTEQSIRGIRHGQYRPDVMIFDDIEDNDSVRTKEGRDKTYQFVTSQAIPAGDLNTKVIKIGNLLHEDSIIKRFINEINLKTRDGIYRTYPFLKDGKPLWPEKFTSQSLIDTQIKKIGNEKVFRREFMLEIVPEDDQVIDLNWIHYYGELPNMIGTGYRFTATGVDLAIVIKDTADFTAFVSALIFGYREELRIYILPNPVNKRMNFPSARSELINLVESLGGMDNVKIYVENTGYQGAFAEDLHDQGYMAEGVSVNSASKRERLAFISHLVRTGKVLFPRQGAEDLITQLVNFGVGHEDLADAFSLLIKKAREDSNENNTVGVICSTKYFYKSRNICLRGGLDYRRIGMGR